MICHQSHYDLHPSSFHTPYPAPRVHALTALPSHGLAYRLHKIIEQDNYLMKQVYGSK